MTQECGVGVDVKRAYGAVQGQPHKRVSMAQCRINRTKRSIRLAALTADLPCPTHAQQHHWISLISSGLTKTGSKTADPQSKRTWQASPHPTV